MSDKFEGTPLTDCDWLIHTVCLGGHCSFIYNDRSFELKENDLAIIGQGQFLKDVVPSPDFKVTSFYASYPFIQYSTPQNHYGVKGAMSLSFNPIMSLNQKQLETLLLDFDSLARRIDDTDNKFYIETIRSVVETTILDFYDIHARLYENNEFSVQNSELMAKFIGMLQHGSIREHRSVAWYAEQLCITPKYLTEISRKISGFTANYWITRYTCLAIAEQLRNQNLSFAQVSEMFNFSTPSYFSRYVLKNIGVKPSDFRN